jgi:membrane protease YdiL (CAAX protease family)
MQMLQFLALVAGSFFIIGLIGSVFSSYISGVSIVEANNITTSSAPESSKLSFMRGLLITQFLIFVIPVLVFAKLSSRNATQYLGLKAPQHAGFWIIGVIILLVALPIVEFTGIINSKMNFGTTINNWMHEKENSARTQLNFILAKRTVSDLILNIICVAMFAGIGEELIFRGVIQRLLIKASKSPWIGIIGAAFLFSFIHFQFFGFIPRFLLGILLGAIYWYSGSLWPAIIAHFIYDAFIIVLIYFNPSMLQNTDAVIIDPSKLAIGAAISTVVVGTMLWWMKKNSTSTMETVYGDEANSNPSEKNFTF